MAAVPKNKITSVERGKRRRGNTPKLLKNTRHNQAQLHKRGLVAQIFQAIGLDNKKN